MRSVGDGTTRMGAGAPPPFSYVFFPRSEKWLTPIIARIWKLGGPKEAFVSSKMAGSNCWPNAPMADAHNEYLLYHIDRYTHHLDKKGLRTF